MLYQKISSPLLTFVIAFNMMNIMSLHATPPTLLQANITPNTPTTAQVPANGMVTVQYQVTNQSTITRPYVVTAITGMTQLTTGTSFCANPFTLAPGESCLLTLQFDGSQIQATITGGPLICKVQRTNDNSTGGSLCVQPPASQQLELTVVTAENAGLTTNISQISLMVGDDLPQHITVSNLSNTITATNVMASLPPEWSDITQDAGDCISIAPLGTCQIEFTPGATSYSEQSVNISGSNTVQTPVTISVNSGPLITFDRSPIIVYPGTIANVTIQNISERTITNIHSSFEGTPLSGVVTESSNTCSTLNVSQSCTLSYTANNTQVSPTSFTLLADNLTPTTLLMSVTTAITLGDALNDGYIFEINPNGSGGKVVTSIDIATGIEWGGYGTSIGSNAQSNTDGAQNMTAIINELTNTQAIPLSSYAAGICSTYVSPGNYSDWYLPAIDELRALWDESSYNNGPITNLNYAGGYWSSSEANSPINPWFANVFYFGGSLDGSAILDLKNTSHSIRCVRIFP